MKPIKMMAVAGARPNFMKIASIVTAIEAHNQSQGNPAIQRILVHTGQHYDEQMSNAFFRDLGIPKPDVDLEVGSGSHAQQTAEIMKRFEGVLLREAPDVLLVVGDVNSTAACSLVASKIAYPPPLERTRPLIAHVEAGLRSFDRSMPEEINRLVTDALSDFLFITEDSAAQNLKKEGVVERKIHWVGNTMVDTLLSHRAKAEESTILSRLGLKASSETDNVRQYALVTLHRPSNVDSPKTFGGILEALSTLAKKIPILFPVHPRTANRIREFGLEASFRFANEVSALDFTSAQIHCVPPLGYLDFLCLTSHASLVLTDSGGIQEETTVLNVPCVTLRENTERPVTVSRGTNVLAGTRKDDILRRAEEKLRESPKNQPPKYWDGRAGARIIEVLVRELGVMPSTQ
ncbi:MAG: UDP-N-acetylglucosamine 2-epimerase (non-hydrolyzing) [Acidobacteria bacterium]|nr:UDP-N-acetylglucosamine 2-epimerase (non-hydrolyzing) [Acidobacteriota bacterium]MCI0622935.1 UDP-N-acetylglucosamine 2-epimerase (non-hydrolyzing) [Acidobacteriota bacterium]MCI0719994.1 UDP-N-acetylglucosamine 2-epimerase (non-hydrolyzing) [Acidobacteriota bacterium]